MSKRPVVGDPALSLTKRIEVPEADGGSAASVARFVVAWLRGWAEYHGYTDEQTEALVKSARPSPRENGRVIVDCQTRLGHALTVTAIVQKMGQATTSGEGEAA